MRITVLGKSPSWQDAGGACSGYLIEDGDTRLLLDCGNGVFSKLRQRLDYTELDAVLISHLHADHFLDLVPYSYALTYAPRQQPVPVGGYPGTDSPARPRLIAPTGAAECFRRVVGAWGKEDLIEKAFAIEEYDAGSTVEVGTLRARFQEVPHFTTTYAVDFTLHERRRPVHLRRRLQPWRRAHRDRPRHRPADRRGDPAAPRAHRGARPHDARGRPAITPGEPAREGSSSPTSPTSSTRTGPAEEGSEAFGAPVEMAERAPSTRSERASGRPRRS